MVPARSTAWPLAALAATPKTRPKIETAPSSMPNTKFPALATNESLTFRASAPGGLVSVVMRFLLSIRESSATAIFEDNEELAVLQRLNGMRKPGPEVPQVTTTDVVDQIAALQVDGRHAGAASQHQRLVSPQY